MASWLMHDRLRGNITFAGNVAGILHCRHIENDFSKKIEFRGTIFEHARIQFVIFRTYIRKNRVETNRTFDYECETWHPPGEILSEMKIAYGNMI